MPQHSCITALQILWVGSVVWFVVPQWCHMWPLWWPLRSFVASEKQPWTIHNWMSRAAFQPNFISRSWSLDVISLSCIIILLILFAVKHCRMRMVFLASELHPNRSCVPFGPQALLLTSVLVWHACCIRTKCTANQLCLQIHTFMGIRLFSLTALHPRFGSLPAPNSHVKKTTLVLFAVLRTKGTQLDSVIRFLLPLPIKEMSVFMLERAILIEAECYLNIIVFLIFWNLAGVLKVTHKQVW